MHESKWLDYEERFDAVLVHVHEHMSDPLDLVTLSRVAGLSPKHWHRVYASAFGETLPATVKRLRLQRASVLLANSELPIAEVAVQVGYPNVASFTRAFGARYGLPPGLYRSSGRHNDFRLALADFEPAAFTVEIRTVEPIACLAVRHRGSYLQIDQAFADLGIWYSAHGYAHTEQQYRGVFLSDPTETTETELRSLACFERPHDFDGAPTPLAVGAADVVEYTIEGGSYAVLTHTGPYAEMPAKYRWLFGCWVLASGRPLADRPVVEHYLVLPQNAAPSELTTEMWLPLADG